MLGLVGGSVGSSGMVGVVTVGLVAVGGGGRGVDSETISEGCPATKRERERESKHYSSKLSSLCLYMYLLYSVHGIVTSSGQAHVR